MNFMNSNSMFPLQNGTFIPSIGYGTWKTPGNQIGVDAVLMALECGYRHTDTAAIYKNEECVGQAVKKSGIPRENIFITSKLWNDMRGYDNTLKAFHETCNKMNIDYLDLFLIHWPNPIDHRHDWRELNRDTWKAMEHLYKNKWVRSIGVSNFMCRHLEPLLETAVILPHVNQLKLCPGITQPEVVDYCRNKGILLEAYSPLGSGKIFKDPIMLKMEKKYNSLSKTGTAKAVLFSTGCYAPQPQHVVVGGHCFFMGKSS